MVNPSPVRFRRRARGWWIFVAVVAATVVGLVGYFVVAPRVQTAVLMAELSTEVPAARASALPAADTAHTAWLKRVSAVLGLPRGAVYSVTYDVCYVDSDGEMAQSYNKKCLLRYIDFFELPETNDVIEGAIQEATKSPAAPYTSTPMTLTDYLDGASRTAEGVQFDLPDTVWVTLPGAADAGTVTDDWMFDEPGIVAYAVAEAFAGRSLLDQQGQVGLNPAQRYLLIADAHPYYTKAVGCAMGRLLFCYSPLGAR